MAAVDGLELVAIDGHDRPRAKAQLAAQFHKLSAPLSDRRAVILPEVGDRLVIGRKTPRQLYQLDIAPRLALQMPA